MTPQMDKYVTLMEDFRQKKMDASAFERQFLETYKKDQTDWNDKEFAILDELFGAVDAFCGDPSLSDDNDLDEGGLLEATDKALAQIRALNAG